MLQYEMDFLHLNRVVSATAAIPQPRSLVIVEGISSHNHLFTDKIVLLSSQLSRLRVSLERISRVFVIKS